jgi:ribosome biogenesis protein ERB1
MPDNLPLAMKRKAVTRDVGEDPAVVSGDEFEFGQLDGTLSDSEGSATSEDGSNSEDFDSLSDEDDVLSDSLATEEVSLERDKSDSEPLEQTVTGKRKEVDISVNETKNGEDNKEEDGRETPNFRVVKDANGNDRFLYDEIDPDDDSEYSAGNDEQNTIGNIPLSFYDSYPHIGYNINGKKIMRPAKGEALDALLDSIEVPKGWTGLTDPSTGKPLELTQEELQLLRKVQMNEVASDGYDPYAPTIEYFTSKLETMPLNAAPEPKRRFVPSKHEAKRVMKIVRAIREGRILPYKPPEEEKEEDEGIQNYDIWANEETRPDHVMHLPAPKLPPPGFDESYHPPPEYLPDQKEKKAWGKADEEDREREFLPTDHDSLRKVPGYDRFVKEKFERCLDLYLAPRVRHTKLNIDPESLLPKLPNPDELKPFPSHQVAIYVGHKGRVRSLAIDPSGRYLATGGDDGTVRLWTLHPPRQEWMAHLGSEEPVNVVRWRPGIDSFILAAAAGDSIYLCIPPTSDLTHEIELASKAILDGSPSTSASKSSTAVAWNRATPSQQSSGIHTIIPLNHTPKSISFHSAGNHFLTVCPATTTPSQQHLAIHTLSTRRSQFPFTKRPRGGGPPQTAHFHPTKPILFVANQRNIRSYDLSKQTLLKIVQPGARWISSFDIHPTSASVAGSDNLIVGSYDRRLLWMDLDLSPRPYKTLRYHEKAIRTVRFHRNAGRFPLFADGSDDGSIQVFHGQVVGDMMSNAQIVPLKVLRGHKVTAGLGVMDLDWHPTEAWLVSAGGDGTCRLWM